MYLESAREVMELLKLEDVVAKDVKEGDVIWVPGQGRVAKVSSIDPMEYGLLSFIDFDKEPVPGCVDGYERSITCKPNDTVKRIPKESLVR